jgi:outer membrane protein TolC
MFHWKMAETTPMKPNKLARLCLCAGAAGFAFAQNPPPTITVEAQAQAFSTSPDLPRGPRDNRQNLGYLAQATLNVPVQNWGATRSKVEQTEPKRDQARLDLTVAYDDALARYKIAIATLQILTGAL